MATAPKPPPINTPLVDQSGRLTQPWYQYLTGGVNFSVNVNRGVSEAKADAAVAQSTANAASQSAQDAQSNSFAVAVDSPYVLASSDAVEPLTTDATTVTPSGGTGPYTYAWTLVSGDTLTINSPTAATTTFTGTPAYNSNLSGVYRCTVTDSLAATASITVSATVFHVPRVVLDF